jgi:hypothetical protein
MYDCFIVERSDAGTFDLDLLERQLEQDPNVARIARPDAREFIVGRSPTHAADVKYEIEKDLRAEYPYVGVIILTPARIWVYQETTADIIEHIRPFFVQLRKEMKLKFLDITGKNTIVDDSPKLDLLFS